MDIVTAQEMYDWDRAAIEAAGIDGKMLMESAGRAVANDMLQHIKKQDKVIILIGAGNNGGDGFVIARTLLNKGYEVDTWQVVPDEKISGDAEAHKKIFLSSGYDVYPFTTIEDLHPHLERADVVIDAMLGIGVKGRLREPYASIIQVVNDLHAFRMSVDLPTGVPAGEGESGFDAFRADYTTIIAAPKLSVFLQQSRPFYGEWNVVEIGLPVPLLEKPKRKLWGIDEVKETFPVRAADSHKGSHGKGLMIGGSAFMPGSIAMAARAALKSGLGLLSVATVREAIPAVSSFVQEATFLNVEEQEGWIAGQALEQASSYDGVLVGMGLGRRDGTEVLLQSLIDSVDGPLIVDADGLYLMKSLLPSLKNRKTPTILTPHPGEFAHLAGVSIEELLKSPFSYSRNFALEYGVHLILKGPSTIITSADGEQRVDVSGNAGLAKGGSGDVLSGILLGMVLQTESLMDAMSNSCVIHGCTADWLTQETHSETDLLASDVIEGLSRTFRTLSSSSRS
ncbi:NAD(P)H-hydrate dehydratase [Halobacillus yeomjeoni]|uniref:NAD(P)H-hydrate dehydratase n=1 Tax=Halobacillus yeomjeoni TaxID=311194 RepID=UPI001CD2DF82|nr:NAD(P)H-hydrate dehydratase [Halobacillus yeomjeoni]MCA0985112.1 NAD(P)H-hydrate dehydratase [Halobacillus yeomjeoni]